MKISYMLKREDFYAINEQTLNTFFEPTNGAKTTLYIYPHLNAITTSTPSKEVRDYIYTEYSVSGSLIKKLLVWGYTRLCLNTFGLFAARKIAIPTSISSQTLIYPCNRKFRIFDFAHNTVSVITKSGFPKNSIKNEIEFRTKSAPCEFILPISDFSDDIYSERIIDGTPLARIVDNRKELEQQALKMWQTYSENSKQTVSASEYAAILQQKFDKYIKKITNIKTSANIAKANLLIKRLISQLRNSDSDIELIQSHGDLQSGNIWVENKTKQIFIIDWESVELRSIWYDAAVLYDDIRKPHCFEAFSKINDLEHTVVVLEEIIYRMNELCELPEDYGSDSFNLFIDKLEN